MIFLEYAVDVAQACRAARHQDGGGERGLYLRRSRGVEFFRHMDAANIDLKGFTEGFYKNLCSGKLAPVLETLEYLKHETDVWFEITTLLIPGENDCARGNRGAERLADGASRSRCAAALHRLSSGLEDAGHAADAAADAVHGAAYRAAGGAALRLYRQHPRSRGPEHLLPLPATRR